MTTDHTELCFGLRHMGSPRAERAADLIEQQAARIAELEKERDALKADAERYRWLRDISEPGVCAFYLSVGQAFAGVKFKRATVDKAIDAQIAALQAEKETR